MRVAIRGAFVAVGSLILAACASSVDGEGNGQGGAGVGGASGAASGVPSGGPSGTTSNPSNGGTSGQFNDPANNGATRPPPSIATVSPLAGDYGTVVTVTGDNLDEASAELVLAGPVEPVKLAMPAAGTGAGNPGDVVLAWSKTEIRFKYPFPAEGAVGITTKSGQAEGGSFAPSWRPGLPVTSAFTRRELLSIVSPAAGTLVAAFDGTTGPHIVVATNGSVTSEAYDRGATALLTMSLFVTAGGAVEGVYASGGTLFHLTGAAGTPAITSTGIAALDAAGGSDGSGVYAWIRKSNATLVRVRPPSWAESGGAVSDPTPVSAPGPSIAVAADDSLFVGWGVNDSGSFPFYDHTAYPVARRLRPGQTTFDAQRTSGSGADDDMIWTRFRPGPDGRVFSYYCANDTGFFGGSTMDCGEGYIDGLGDLSEPTDATHGEQISGWNATVAATASCDRATATLRLGPEGNTASAKPILFPCPSVIGVQPDPAGDPMLLVQVGNYLYHPRKRP